MFIFIDYNKTINLTFVDKFELELELLPLEVEVEVEVEVEIEVEVEVDLGCTYPISPLKSSFPVSLLFI
jgi:hypothetical protein